MPWANKERQREMQKKWRDAHRAEMKTKRAQWAAEHKEWCREWKRQWVKKHPDRAREIWERWNKLHPVERKRISRESKKRTYANMTDRERKALNLRKHGLSIERYEEMIANQGGGCAICGDVSNTGLVVDHDHSSGQVRGLLCVRCNSMLGMAKDNQRTLILGAEYLRAHVEGT